MSRNWIESIVGAGVLAVAVWFITFSYQAASGGGAADGYTLVAKFTGVDGVTVGSDIRISGINVGKVESLKLDPVTYLAEVRMTFAPKTQIPTDSTVAVKSESLLGGRYLSVQPGADDLMLAEGEEIQFTQPAMIIEDLVGQLIFSNDDKK
jgi:phospholipid/cholesterol/gamma-HCH transport system substrate-binding protein